MALRPGDVLHEGRYRTTRRLDQGGTRNVYLAEDTLLHRDVAVKELVPGDDTLVKRLLSLAEAAKALRHDRVVAVYDVLTEQDAAGQTRHFVVMEYMPGGSLEDLLRQRTSLPAEDAARIAADVCEALAYAHERGIVHCALRPASILFTAEAPGSARGTAKVAGFGIAGISDEMLSRIWPGADGFAAGTLPYMSPERLEGLRRDPRIDVYSLGAILYRMLTGQTYLEFDEQRVVAATARNVELIRHKKPVRPGSHVPRVPDWLDAAVLKALSKRAKDRYPDCVEFGNALVAPKPGEAVAAAGGRRSGALFAALRGRRLLRLLVVAVLLAAVAGLVAAGTQFVPGWIDDWQQTSTARAGETRVALAATGTAAAAEETRLAVPTLTPTFTPLPPTLTPSPTISLMPPTVPAPTFTASPIPTNTPIDTPTPVPPTETATPVPPTATEPPPPTARPPTSTPLPTPTATPRPLLSPAELLEPGEAATFAYGSEFYLLWSWDGALDAGEYFDVRVWLDGQPHWGLGWTKDDRYRLSTEDLSNRYPDAPCGAAINWAVAVVEGEDGILAEERSPESEPRTFYVEFAHCR